MAVTPADDNLELSRRLGKTLVRSELFATPTVVALTSGASLTNLESNVNAILRVMDDNGFLNLS
jgi:hypothetical protein